jgi:thiol-disulfide isomerase/thioredoxin
MAQPRFPYMKVRHFEVVRYVSMKTRISRRFMILPLALSLLLSACSGQPASPTPVPTSAIPAAEPRASDLKDYIASDPSLVKNTGRPQFVEFFAFWCTTCQAMRPLIHKLQDEYGERVDFIYLDIDADNTKALRQELQFTGLRPTIVFLSGEGTEMGRMIGMHSEDELSSQIDSLLTSG